jgi:hypothetical protein
MTAFLQTDRPVMPSETATAHIENTVGPNPSPYQTPNRGETGKLGLSKKMR